MEYISLIFLLFLLILPLYFFKQKNTNIKSKTVKKEEIIQEYFSLMEEVLEKNKDNKQLQVQEKIKLLKNINNELAMNIFFDEEEAKKILKDLSNLG